MCGIENTSDCGFFSVAKKKDGESVHKRNQNKTVRAVGQAITFRTTQYLVVSVQCWTVHRMTQKRAGWLLVRMSPTFAEVFIGFCCLVRPSSRLPTDRNCSKLDVVLVFRILSLFSAVQQKALKQLCVFTLNRLGFEHTKPHHSVCWLVASSYDVRTNSGMVVPSVRQPPPSKFLLVYHPLPFPIPLYVI
jgi:hypothetical protein